MRKGFFTIVFISAFQISGAAHAQVMFEMIMPTYGPNGQVTWPDGTVSSSAGPSTEGTLQMMGYTDTTPGTVNQAVGGVWGGTDPSNAGYAYPTTTAATSTASSTSGAVWGGTSTSSVRVSASPSVATTASTGTSGAVFGGTDSSKATTTTTTTNSGAVFGGTSPTRSYTTTTGPSGETIYTFSD